MGDRQGWWNIIHFTKEYCVVNVIRENDWELIYIFQKKYSVDYSLLLHDMCELCSFSLIPLAHTNGGCCMCNVCHHVAMCDSTHYHGNQSPVSIHLSKTSGLHGLEGQLLLSTKCILPEGSKKYIYISMCQICFWSISSGDVMVFKSFIYSFNFIFEFFLYIYFIIRIR